MGMHVGCHPSHQLLAMGNRESTAVDAPSSSHNDMVYMLKDIKLGPRSRDSSPPHVSGPPITMDRRVMKPSMYGRLALSIDKLYLWRQRDESIVFPPSMERVVVGAEYFPKHVEGVTMKKAFEVLLDTLASLMVPTCHLRNDVAQEGLSMADVMTLDTFRYPLVRLDAPDVPTCMFFDKGKVGEQDGFGVDGDGYLVVLLGKDADGKRIFDRVHRLVGWAFHGPPRPGFEVLMHSCNRTNCLSPPHTSWGSQAQNSVGRKHGQRRKN